METASSAEFDEECDGIENEGSLLSRHIKCPIHDHIPISPTLARFIDTRQFQRLRKISQLGTTSYVWPGATHTRFEHCLGVAYLARLMASHLQASQPLLKITDRDVDCVEIAGLCHDLGHGPWSHVWDGLFMPAALKNCKWTHEEGSEFMFDALVEEHKVPISVEDQLFVKALISGEHCRTPHEKEFLFDIVANKRNGLDVDKFDYIHRDSHMIGDPITFSLSRLVKSARVIDNQICYDIKDANHLYDICANRFKLHKTVYNHKSAKAIEYMIIDALLSADTYMKISVRVFEKEQYIFLTDDIMARIESTTEPELEEARTILKRIHTRNLYKCVDYKVVDWPFREIFKEHVTAARIVEAARNLSNSPSASLFERSESSSSIASDEPEELDVSDVIVDFSKMHYGMGKHNPLDSVRFYSKRRPNESMKAERGVYSNLMPQYFAEVLLRVYTKKQKFYGLVQAGYRAVLADLQASMNPDGSLVDAAELTINVDSIVPTPPATEAPSTPKPHSRTASFTYPPGGSGAMATPFANNQFTTVSPTFAPVSPTQAHKKAKGRKRSRDETTTATAATAKKRKV